MGGLPMMHQRIGRGRVTGLGEGREIVIWMKNKWKKKGKYELTSLTNTLYIFQWNSTRATQSCTSQNCSIYLFHFVSIQYLLLLDSNFTLIPYHFHFLHLYLDPSKSFFFFISHHVLFGITVHWFPRCSWQSLMYSQWTGALAIPLHCTILIFIVSDLPCDHRLPSALFIAEFSVVEWLNNNGHLINVCLINVKFSRILTLFSWTIKFLLHCLSIFLFLKTCIMYTTSLTY